MRPSLLAILIFKVKQIIFMIGDVFNYRRKMKQIYRRIYQLAFVCKALVVVSVLQMEFSFTAQAV